MAEIVSPGVNRAGWQAEVLCPACGTGIRIKKTDVFRGSSDAGSLSGLSSPCIRCLDCGARVFVADQLRVEEVGAFRGLPTEQGWRAQQVAAMLASGWSGILCCSGVHNGGYEGLPKATDGCGTENLVALASFYRVEVDGGRFRARFACVACAAETDVPNGDGLAAKLPSKEEWAASPDSVPPRHARRSGARLTNC